MQRTGADAGPGGAVQRATTQHEAFESWRTVVPNLLVIEVCNNLVLRHLCSPSEVLAANEANSLQMALQTRPPPRDLATERSTYSHAAHTNTRQCESLASSVVSQALCISKPPAPKNSSTPKDRFWRYRYGQAGHRATPAAGRGGMFRPAPALVASYALLCIVGTSELSYPSFVGSPGPPSAHYRGSWKAGKQHDMAVPMTLALAPAAHPHAHPPPSIQTLQSMCTPSHIATCRPCCGRPTRTPPLR